MRMTPTRTDANGNGYYRGSDGNYYYGNIKRGYVTETRETARNRMAAEQRAQRPAQAMPMVGGLADFNPIGDFLGLMFSLFKTAFVALPVLFGIGAVYVIVTQGFGLWPRYFSMLMNTLRNAGLMETLGTGFHVIGSAALGAWALVSAIRRKSCHWAVLMLGCTALNILWRRTVVPSELIGDLFNGATEGLALAFPMVVLLLLVHLVDAKLIRRYGR